MFDALEQIREVAINIQLGEFCATPFKFQDGPDICFARSKQELERETQESSVEPHLRIGEQDIQENLQRRNPRKRP